MSEHEQAIDKVRGASPDYISLEARWRKIAYELILERNRATYASAGLTEKQLQKISETQFQEAAIKLSNDELKRMLDDMHAKTQEIAVQQLQSEQREAEDAAARERRRARRRGRPFG